MAQSRPRSWSESEVPAPVAPRLTYGVNVSQLDFTDTKIPGSVARWLNELRRDTDSGEIEEELRLKVECDAVASEVEILETPPIDHKQNIDQDFQFATNKSMATSSRNSSTWNRNPVFKSISQEDTVCTSTTSSFKSLCKEARRASQSLVDDLEDCADENNDIYQSVSSCVTSDDNRVSVDVELEQLSQEAVSIADEALAQCAREGRVMEGVARGRSASATSEFSDDVFFATTPPGDINNIFDQGKLDEESPPTAPPRRKKKTSLSSGKEIFKQIEVFTAQAKQKDIDNIAISTKPIMNKKLEKSDSGRTVVYESPKIIKDNNIKKMGELLNSEKRVNNEITKDTKEDKTIKKKPEVSRAVSTSCRDTELCNPIFAQRFSLQIVDRKTYYPEIQHNNSSTVPKLSQEVKALYVDEANLKSDLQCEERLEQNNNELKNEEKLAMALLDEATREQESEAEESMRSRKGSFSSDIVAWKQELLQQWDRLEDEEDLKCYQPGPAPEEWFSSSDREGRLYFFEENSNESSWTLPEASTPSSAPPLKNKSPASSNNSISSTDKKDKPIPTSAVKAAAAAIARQGALADRRCTLATTECRSQENRLSGDEEEETHVRARLPPGALLLPAYTNLARGSKTRSMVLVDTAKRSSAVTEDLAAKCASIPRNWPQLWDSGMGVLKEGMLNKTKLTEHGKKLRKNWASSHVVLTEMFLLFCRDAKSFAAIKSGNLSSSMPEMCVGLNCASLESGDKLSSRKNVFVVSTTDGLQVLCQEDNMSAADSWFYNIGLAIKNYGMNTTPRVKLLPSREPSPQTPDQPESPNEDKKSNSSLNRTKSVKIKKDTGSVEDLTASPTSANSAEQTKIKNRLRKFFIRRPTKESLVKKGILQDEPAFGSYLAKLCRDMPDEDQIPVFVKRCIGTIESKPENMRTDGLYRASGNLSQVQKIRLQVDQNNLGVLDLEEDVHVLTGALKLFFRELKEPLIPFDAFNKALKASTNPNKKEKLQQFREIVTNLPGPNHDTLKFLLQHLLRVTLEQSSNRMHIPNLAIVFGPTLMWPEEESLNMAFDLMQQNIVIESLLQEFEAIFR